MDADGEIAEAEKGGAGETGAPQRLGGKAGNEEEVRSDGECLLPVAHGGRQRED